jgi:hypothetical protein
MSIQAADLRKLVKIVRQYEVIYGGGISSSDAAVREECDGLVGLLEAELGGRKPSGGPKSAKSSAALPSLVDARAKPREAGPARPLGSRATELAKLTSPKGEPKAKEPEPKAKAEKKAPGDQKAPIKGKAVPAKAEKAGAVKAPPAKASPAKASDSKASSAKASAAASKAPAGKAAPVKAAPRQGEAAKSAARESAEEVYKDVRSRHAGAVKAAAERADMIAGKADDSGSAPEKGEVKKRFAALHLFDAFQQSRLPKYGGFIVCVRFSDETGYTVIEIIGYGNMQDLYPEGDTLVFKSVGCKLYAIVEPSGYLLKSVEPVNRPSEQAIPYRFSELLHITTKRFQGIFVGRKPVFMPTSFSVFKPSGEDLAVLFYDIADVYSNIQDFLIMILRDRLGVPVPDSRKAAEVIARGIREFRLWLDEA